MLWGDGRQLPTALTGNFTSSRLTIKNLELRLFIVLAYPVTHISKIVVSFNLSGLIFEQRWSHEAERGG